MPSSPSTWPDVWLVRSKPLFPNERPVLLAADPERAKRYGESDYHEVERFLPQSVAEELAEALERFQSSLDTAEQLAAAGEAQARNVNRVLTDARSQAASALATYQTHIGRNDGS
jgi:hypothetical protein